MMIHYQYHNIDTGDVFRYHDDNDSIRYWLCDREKYAKEGLIYYGYSTINVGELDKYNKDDIYPFYNISNDKIINRQHSPLLLNLSIGLQPFSVDVFRRKNTMYICRIDSIRMFGLYDARNEYKLKHKTYS